MEAIAIAGLTLVASFIGTITGFGTSTLMIPVLVLFLPSIEVIFLVAIIHGFGDLWRIFLFRSGIRWRLVLLFGVSGLTLSYLGARLALGANQTALLRWLGLFLLLYALFLLLQKRFKVPASSGTALTGGALSGFSAGFFGIGGAIRSVFLLAFDLPKAVYIATAGAIGLLVDTSRITTYWSGGASLSRALVIGLIVAVPVSFVGAKLAQRVVARIPQARFRLVVSTFLFIIGLKLLVWP